MAYRVVWPEPRRAEIEEFEPDDPGAGEVLLRASQTVISPGTERGWLTNSIGFPDFPGFRGGFPFRPGYSIAGEVVATGTGVTRLTPGDRVITGGFGWGCHATHSTWPEFIVDPIPDDVTMDQAVFFGLGDVAIFGARRARIELGESVVVLGLGPIGLLSVQVARLCGAAPVVALDLSPFRRDRARQMGADVVVDAADRAAIDAAMRELDGGGADAVLELTARREPLDLALEIVKPLGRIVMITADANPYTANLHEGLFRKGASLTGVFTAARPMHDSQPGSWTPARDRDTYLRLVSSGRLDVAPLITDRYAARDAPDAYARLLAGDDTMIGAVFDWSAN
jgi:2-desacetyl-2-hydroxyethyl bacteriochlorophyllide A dehydrogenase